MSAVGPSMAIPERAKGAEIPWGATAADWDHFSRGLGLQQDLLPVVSNPKAVISPKSKMASLGKVPSTYNRDGEVVGIAEWPRHHTTSRDITQWTSNCDHGICIQTREVRAIDVDINDPESAERVYTAIGEALGRILPKRGRANSGNFLLAFRMLGEFRKRTIRTQQGLIEFLATGQQFVAIGTHPKGARYEWGDGSLPREIPEVTPAQFEALWANLKDNFGLKQATQLNVEPCVDDTDAQLSDRAVTSTQVPDETIADLRSAISVLRHEAEDYDLWVRGGHALKSLEMAGRHAEAAKLWHEFSSLSSKYDYDEAEEKWAGFNPRDITFKTIFAMAAKRGWINPRCAEVLKDDVDGSSLIDRSDAGNVALLAKLTDGDLKFVPQRRTWLMWSDNRWTVDSHGVNAQFAALQVAKHHHDQAVEFRRQSQTAALNEAEKKRLDQVATGLEKWARQCRNKRAIDAMLALAQGDARFVVSADQLDLDPWLFGVHNGVIDLRTGQLRVAAREDYVSKRSPISYDPSARAPRWEQFINEVTAEPDGRGSHRVRPLLAQYMQLALGYSMTGLTREQKMFMAIGEGSNGKNVLLDTLQALMGDYCVTVPPEALMATRADADAERPSSVAATLAGARLAISSESKNGQRLDVALVKRHTGGGYMNARFMRENSFRFEITHKLWLMTNHRPALDHIDPAMRGRLHLIPFDMAWNRPGHPDNDPTLPNGDKDLMAKLRSEAAGILTWLVSGAVAYNKKGLEPPSEVVRMTRDFFSEQDPVGRWILTMQRCEAREGTAASELYEAFQSWRVDEMETGGPESLKAFAEALKARRVPSHRLNKGTFYGLRGVDAADLA